MKESIYPTDKTKNSKELILKEHIIKIESLLNKEKENNENI